MSNEQVLQQAKAYIQQERYADAYQLLRQISDDPTAQRWLARIEGMQQAASPPSVAPVMPAPDATPAKPKRGISPTMLKIGGIVVFALVFAVFILGSGQLPGGGSQTFDEMVAESMAEQPLTAVEQEQQIISTILLVLGGVGISGLATAQRYKSQGKSPFWGFVVGLLLIANIALVFAGGLFSGTGGDYKCSGCGASLSGHESTCPRCGAKLKRGLF